MKPVHLLTLLLLCALLLSGCAYEPTLQRVTATPVPGTAPLMPEAEAPESLNTSHSALLYYRYGSQPYLASESRDVTGSPSQAYEYSLLTTLLAGPALQDGTLTPLFPDGTRVISTSRQGRMLFVTLSREIMNGYPDEPDDWRQRPEWTDEVPLRRRLAIQSLVATVTENCEFDSVQILVEQSADTASPSLRLRQTYFMDSHDDTVLTGPQVRDSSLLLSPTVTGQLILTCLLRQDWQTLYLYMADKDPATGESLPSYSDFVTLLNNLPALTDWTLEGVTVSGSGTRATLTVSGRIMDPNGLTLSLNSRCLHLTLENGIWRVGLNALTGWMY